MINIAECTRNMVKLVRICHEKKMEACGERVVEDKLAGADKKMKSKTKVDDGQRQVRLNR